MTDNFKAQTPSEIPHRDLTSNIGERQSKSRQSHQNESVGSGLLPPSRVGLGQRKEIYEYKEPKNAEIYNQQTEDESYGFSVLDEVDDDYRLTIFKMKSAEKARGQSRDKGNDGSIRLTNINKKRHAD